MMRQLMVGVGILGIAGGAWAQDADPLALPDIGVDKKLDQTVPLDLAFWDEEGKRVRLGDYFNEKPVILAPVYYECPMLCTLILNGLLESTKALKFDAGNEYQVVAFSFDPEETPALAARKKAGYMTEYGRPGTEGGWHFLTGDEASIQRLTEAVGFRYRYEEKSGEFAHPSSIMVLTPGGKISSYFHGIDYPSKDMRLALVDAAEGRIGSLIDRALLFCFHYDPVTGKYGFTILSVLRLMGILTLLAMGGFIALSLCRDRRLRSPRHA